jgi:hypothetical protein
MCAMIKTTEYPTMGGSKQLYDVISRRHYSPNGVDSGKGYSSYDAANQDNLKTQILVLALIGHQSLRSMFNFFLP